MQDFKLHIDTQLKGFRNILICDLKVEPEVADQLIESFRGWLDKISTKDNKLMYLHIISSVLQLLSTEEHRQLYLPSLGELDITSRWVTYVTPIETATQDVLYKYYVFCSQAIQARHLTGFRGVEFVHRFNVGAPKPIKIKHQA
jgi:hypothetical protein